MIPSLTRMDGSQLRFQSMVMTIETVKKQGEWNRWAAYAAAVAAFLQGLSALLGALKF